MSLPEKYLGHRGLKRTAFDRRRLWAAETRELSNWAPNPQAKPGEQDDHLSRGERAARARFADLIIGGPNRPPVDAVTALRDALELNCGPILALETREEFDAYWSHDRLVEIANRWRESRHFTKYSKGQVAAAHRKLGAAADIGAAVLVEIATNPKASAAARVKAAGTILASVGIIAGSKLEDEEIGQRKNLKAQAAKLFVMPKATGTEGA